MGRPRRYPSNAARQKAYRDRVRVTRRSVARRSRSQWRGMSQGAWREYNSWRMMIQRCCNPKTDNYSRYGGANPPVTVCDRWNPRAGGSFENFLAHKGPRPDGTSIGRTCDLGNYEPPNCRWMTVAEQTAERRKRSRILACGLWALRRKPAVSSRLMIGGK